jgi:putative nucleotidyltransferase with HDIG domain
MRRVATSIVRRLAEAGYTALFAGGCVRDMVRGVEPHDYDIATTATPEEVQRLFPKTIPVGAQFGVVLVLENDHQFEVATFRTDEAYVDGRRPSSVRYGTPEQDAQRRDFTINGLFYDALARETRSGALSERALPGIIDYVGGQADIARKLVRTIGEPRARFAEDKLRMLRCVRFAANLGYEIDPDTFAAVQEMAAQIGVVSAERIRDELVKTFTRPNAGRGLVLLEESGLLQQILPEVAAMKGVEQPPEFHPEGDVFTHTKLMLDLMSEAVRVDASTSSAQALRPPEAGIILALAALLHDVGKPPTFERAPDRVRFHEHDKVGGELSEKILQRLRFPNEVIEKVCVCVGEHMRIRHVQDMRPAKLKRILARETFADELELHRLDCLASHGDIANYEFLRAKAAELPPEVIKPAPLVTGHDLLELGFAQGPLLGQVLRELEELQLEERLQSREDALAYARAQLARRGG